MSLNGADSNAFDLRVSALAQSNQRSTKRLQRNG